MKYADISKETIQHLYDSHSSLKDSPLDPVIKALVELRVSQINGCSHCCYVHAKEARELEIPERKLDLLPAWDDSHAFTEQEALALQWAEEMTLL